MSTTIVSAARARASGPAPAAIDALVAALRSGLAGDEAAVVIYFASATYDPTQIAGLLSAAFSEAVVLGCSTAGEFTDEISDVGGVSAIALPTGIVTRCASALIDLAGDPREATLAAAEQIGTALGSKLRDLDTSTHLGFILIDGLHGAEETVNGALGESAPLLNVVGGSAGDDLAFTDSWVTVGSADSHQGAVLLVCEMARPFSVLKSCSFTPTGHTLRVTRADVAQRVVYEFDGRPAVEAYAEAIGQKPEAVDSAAFMRFPVGLMIDEAAFIRSPQQVVDGGGIRFYCQILEGMEVDVMRSGDIVGETAAAVKAAVEDVGGRAAGAVMFNCILRRLELDADGQLDAFVRCFDGVPTAGFHTYGETWLGHINQTITGVVFG